MFPLYLYRRLSFHWVTRIGGILVAFGTILDSHDKGIKIKFYEREDCKELCNDKFCFRVVNFDVSHF